MRDVRFKVRVGSQIKLFASYAEAEAYGKIVGVTIVPVDEKTEKQKAEQKAHARKIYERYSIVGKK